MVSVVIPTYNRYDLLKRAIKSVIAQTYQPSQIIVVDDGSDDETSNIKTDFPNIIYHYQENRGVSSARNAGIKLSTCKWIAFLDSDDEWHEEKLKKQLEFHNENRECLISYTDEKWIRNNKDVALPKKYKKHGGYVFEKFLSHCIVAPSSVLLHAELFEKYGYFDETLEVCEDYDLFLKISKHEQFGLIDEKLITKYSHTHEQLSTKYWGMDRFRVKSLANIYTMYKDETVLQELINKYNLLLKGAVKHNKMEDIETYKKKLLFYTPI